MRVGFWSPMPPAKTGVADYAAALFEELRKSGDVRLNDASADIALYHIGNNQLHREIYRRAIERPGIVVLHDAVLQHFFLGSLEERPYIEEFVFNYGEWSRGLAEDLWRNRARSAADARYFEWPMLKRIVSRSRAVIVHNPAAAAAAVRRHSVGDGSTAMTGGPSGIFEIPHLFVPRTTPDEVETLRFRESLGVGPGTLLVSIFGHLRESKRPAAVVRAMQRAWQQGADARLLIAGEFASSDLERAAAGLFDDPRILRRGYLPEEGFWRHTAATDVCMNLRWPRAGETSGIAIRLMGIGKAVVFTNGEEIARIPEGTCLRVDVGSAEEETLAEMVLWLARDREAAMEIGRRAARHIEAEHRIDRVAKKYWEAIDAALKRRAE